MRLLHSGRQISPEPLPRYIELYHAITWDPGPGRGWRGKVVWTLALLQLACSVSGVSPGVKTFHTQTHCHCHSTTLHLHQSDAGTRSVQLNASTATVGDSAGVMEQEEAEQRVVEYKDEDYEEYYEEYYEDGSGEGSGEVRCERVVREAIQIYAESEEV